MDVMNRKLPSKILVLDALKRRIDETHEKHQLVTSLLRRAEIGYRGELKVDRLWREIAVPTDSILLHSYESRNDVDHSHQIDTLFLCPHFLLILEIKNVSGTIFYESEKYQFLRKRLTGEVESFQSPFEQVKRHRDFIVRIVEGLGLSIPVHAAVVLAETSTIIGSMKSGIPIFHAVGLPSEIKRLLLRYESPALSAVHYELLAHHIRNLHKPGVYKPKFEIPPIRKGALCECGKVMKYNYGKFICSCGIKSKEPLYQGLQDYRWLINEWISNREFRNFFYIKSEDSASKLLKKMNFLSRGSTRDRFYLITENIWKHNG